MCSLHYEEEEEEEEKVARRWRIRSRGGVVVVVDRNTTEHCSNGQLTHSLTQWHEKEHETH